MKVVSTESRERGSILEKESDARQLTDRDWRQATVQWLYPDWAERLSSLTQTALALDFTKMA